MAVTIGGKKVTSTSSINTDTNSSIVLGTSTSSVSVLSSSSNWLAETDVDLLPQPRPKQAIMALIGDDGHCKTGFCLRYLPDPIVLFSFDGRAEHEIDFALESGRIVYPVRFPQPTQASGLKPSEAKQAGLKICAKVKSNLAKFSQASREKLPGAPRSIVFDTASEFNLWCDLAYRGTTNAMETKSIDDDGKQERKFGNPGYDINREFWDIFGLCRYPQAYVHLVLICRQSEIWIDNAPTGQFKIDGDKVISRGSDMVVRISRQKERIKISKEGQSYRDKLTGRTTKDTELTMVEAKTNIMEMNKLYQPEMWKKDEDAQNNPFVYLCMKNYKNSTREDWK